MTEEQGLKMETKQDIMDIFKARQEDFKPFTHEPKEEKEMKHMRGLYAGEVMQASRICGEKDGREYDFIAISVRVIGNGPKTKVNGVNRWLKKQYSLKDKVNQAGEIYATAESEIDRLLNDFHTIGLPVTFKTTEELEGLLAEMSAKKDMDDKYVAGTGKKVYMDVQPRFNAPTKGSDGKQKFELKFDEKGFPMQKFEFVPDIPGYVEEGEETTSGGM